MIGTIRWGVLNGRTPVQVSRVSLAFRRLPEAFDGFRVALAADLHYGPLVRSSYVRRVIELIARQRPDLVVLAGDMLKKPIPFASSLGRMLGELARQAPTYAVLGNHEHYSDAAPYRRALRSAGVDLLVNEHRLIGRGSAVPPGRGPRETIALAGVDDFQAGRPDFHAALDGVAPGTFTLLAGHNPDLADLAGEELSVDLMLCGHTPLYISRGLGVSGIPLRIDCDPELPIITLRRRRG